MKTHAEPLLHDVDALLAPISQNRPAGESLRYEVTYDLIVAARRDDDPNIPLGIWSRELKTADWHQVEALCTDALKERTKDLQIGAWLLEAWLQQGGFHGVADGLQLLRTMTERYWESVHPELDPEDAEIRCAPFFWMNEKLAWKLYSIAITSPTAEEISPYRWVDWQQLQWLDKAKHNQGNGKQNTPPPAPLITHELFARSVALTPGEFFDSRIRDLRRALEHTSALQEFLDERMGRDAPSLVRFREGLSTLADWMVAVLSARVPAPVAAPAPEKKQESTTEEVGAAPPTATAAAASPPLGSAALATSVASVTASRDSAYRALGEIADYLMEIEPHSPTPFLVRRAAAWGELSLGELMQEANDAGLDIGGLFTFLGINEV